MTHDDIQFLKVVGIDPSCLGDPLAGPFTPLPPAEPPVPKLPEDDSRWLRNLRVVWEHETEPEFEPPKTLSEYLDRFPHGISEATLAVANEMGLRLTDGSLEDLAQEIKDMFVGFDEEGLEDVVALFPFHQSLRPGFSFHDYMKFRVRACVPVVLQNRMTDADNLGESR
jgi:hypothetical protein